MMFSRFTFSSISNQTHVSRSKLYTVMRCIHCGSNLKSSPNHWSQSPTRVFGNRISRAMKEEAQKALFDYLYKTRSLSFVDAEHISKNSPRYVMSLLSKIEVRKEDISQSLSSFLRHNPIDEFEPFLESLGLRPSEVSRFLPRDMVFLSDDGVLLENFHVFCSYGFPRGTIGRVFKEVREVFGYENGVLVTKLEGYESLGLSKSVVTKLVTCCPWLLVGGVESEFVSVVSKLNELNVGYDWLWCSSDSKRYNWRWILETMEILKEVGFEKEKLSSLLKAYPNLVGQTCENSAYVMFEKLRQVGFRKEEIDKLVVTNPEMLLEKSVYRIVEALRFMTHIRMKKKFIVSFVVSHLKRICSTSLLGPKGVYIRLNIGRNELRRIIKEKPLRLFSLASKTEKIRVEYDKKDSRNAKKLKFLLKLGYVENSDEMMRALKKVQGRGDKLQERFDCLVEAGLDYSVVTEIVKRAPHILNRPKDTIEKKINILTDYLGYPVESLVEAPSYLCYSMERIHKRFSMYIWLREKKSVRPGVTVNTIVGVSDARFVALFVVNHPEGPATWERIKKRSTCIGS